MVSRSTPSRAVTAMAAAAFSTLNRPGIPRHTSPSTRPAAVRRLPKKPGARSSSTLVMRRSAGPSWEKVRMGQTAWSVTLTQWGSSMLATPTRHWRKSRLLQWRYSPKSACSPAPMWSGERLRNAPKSNWMPSVRWSLKP